jgi:hypothetical protein
MDEDKAASREDIRAAVATGLDGLGEELRELYRLHYRRLFNLDYDLDRIDRGNQWERAWEGPSGTATVRADVTSLPTLLREALWSTSEPVTDVLFSRAVTEALAEAVRRAASGDGELLGEIGDALVPERFRPSRPPGRNPPPLPSEVARDWRLVSSFDATKNQIAALNRLLPNDARTLDSLRAALLTWEWMGRLSLLTPPQRESIEFIFEVGRLDPHSGAALAATVFLPLLPEVRRIRVKTDSVQTAALRAWARRNRLSPKTDPADFLKELRERNRKRGRTNYRGLLRPKAAK